MFEKEFGKLPDYARAALAVLMRQYLNGELVTGDIKPIRDDVMELRWRQVSIISEYCSSAGASTRWP